MLCPTVAQVIALRAFKTANGRNWKSKLRQAWETGNYSGDANAPELQRVRNTLGPTWLHRERQI